MIFVTGATGFLGKSLIPLLIEKGYRVKILARPTSDVSFFTGMPNLQIAPGDILDLASLERGMVDCRAVVHAAALFRFWGQVESFGDTNIVGTQNVLQAALKLGLKRVVHISSIAVIGIPPSGSAITEATTPNPVDPYQQSKLGAERIVQSYAQNFALETVILRLGALYGPWGKYAFNRLFFEEFLRGWRIQVSGGRHITFPCYVKDAAQAIEASLRVGKPGAIYNICGESISHKAINKMVSRQAGKSNWRLNTPQWLMLTIAHILEWLAKLTNTEPYYPLNLRPYVFADWLIDTQKAQNELAFSPTPIEQGVRETLEWYREIGLL